MPILAGVSDNVALCYVKGNALAKFWQKRESTAVLMKLAINMNRIFFLGNYAIATITHQCSTKLYYIV